MTKSLKALDVDEVMGSFHGTNRVIAKDIQIPPTYALSFLDTNRKVAGIP